MFAKEDDRKYLGQLVNKLFLNLKKKNVILPQHNEKLYHCKAVELAKMFAAGIENPTVRITAIGNQMKLKNREENRNGTGMVWGLYTIMTIQLIFSIGMV